MKRTYRPFIFMLCVTTALQVVANPGKENSPKEQPVIIKGRLDYLKDGDTLKLQIDNYGITNTFFRKTYFTVCKDHTFNFRVSGITNPQHIRLSLKQHMPGKSRINAHFFSPYYIVEPGDNILIQDTEEHPVFFGNSAVKYACQYLLDSVQNTILNLPNRIASTPKQYFELIDSSTIRLLTTLDSFRNKMSMTAYLMLKTGIICSNKNRKYGLIETETKKETEYKMALLNSKNFDSLINQTDRITNALQYSAYYAYYVMAKYTLDSCILQKKPFDIGKYYAYVKANYSDAVREQIITYFIDRYFKNIGIKEYVIDALGYIRNPYFKGFLTGLINSRLEGAIAYNFRLPDTNGKIHQLSDYKGKVVVIDFWFTGCPPCRLLSPTLKMIEQKLSGNHSIVFMSISRDKDKTLWKGSVASGAYTSPGIINLYTQGKGNDHEVFTRSNVYAFPTVIVIDKDGKIANSPVVPGGNDGKDLLASIEKLL